MNEDDHLNCLKRCWSMTDDAFSHFTAWNWKQWLLESAFAWQNVIMTATTGTDTFIVNTYVVRCGLAPMQVAKVSFVFYGFWLFFFVRSTHPPQLAAVLLLTPLLASGRVKTTMYYCLDTYSSFASSLLFLSVLSVTESLDHVPIRSTEIF